MRAGLLLAACAACASADAMAIAPPAARPTADTISEIGLYPGEHMAFEVRLAGMLAGEAQLAVGELGDYDGRRAVVVKSRAATAGAVALVRRIVDEATTVVDMASGVPLRLDTRVEQGESHTTASATFTGDPGGRRAEISVSRNDQAPRITRVEFGATTVHDAHSAMAQLRGWRASPGQARSVFIVGIRRIWRVDITCGGPDTIASPIGNRRAIRFTGASYHANRALAVEPGRPARSFTVWLSDDADRVPLKLTATTEFGEIVMDLTEYSR